MFGVFFVFLREFFRSVHGGSHCAAIEFVYTTLNQYISEH